MARPDRLEGQAWRKASKSFQEALFEAGRQISQTAVVALDGAAAEFIWDVGSQNGDRGEVPYYTGNLLDSIGVRILDGNTIRSFRTMDGEGLRHATKPQHMNGVKDIWGYLEIMRRINRPSRRTGKSIVSQLMVGVPYAQEVDWTHDYFSSLSDRFSSKMEQTLKVLEKYRYIVDV